MKKNTLCLIIIILFAAFVFWTGLSQRRIDADSFGVLQTKTSGLNEKPLMAGEFNWNWEFLLPTNANLKLFKINPYNCQKSITGQLPSGPLYSKLINDTYNFDYSFDFSIGITIAPEAIIQLIKLNQINEQKDLDAYFDQAASTIAQLSANYLLEKKQENPKFMPESMRKDELMRNIQVFKEFPDIEIYAISISNSKFPDFELYNTLKDNYSIYSNNIQKNITQNTQDEKND